MSEPAAIGSKGRKVDDVVTEIQNGPKQKQKQKPAYARAATPERNATYDDMESRIYGNKSAKARK